MSNGDRPYGNDLDPTLNLDVLELCFRNCGRWKIVETPQRLATVRKIVDFQRRLTESGAFADPRSHIYYLPELYCAYFGRCYAALRALSPAQQEAIDPDKSFETIRRHVIDTSATTCSRRRSMHSTRRLRSSRSPNWGRIRKPSHRRCPVSPVPSARAAAGRPFNAYEWNKMKTPTRIWSAVPRSRRLRAVGAGPRAAVHDEVRQGPPGLAPRPAVTSVRGWSTTAPGRRCPSASPSSPLSPLRSPRVRRTGIRSQATG